MQRLAKFISHSGICSRRDAEKLILDGRIKVNSTKITSPALNVSESDIVELDGKILKMENAVRLWKYYKPCGLITSYKDELGRPTVFENLTFLPKVISIGRLDLNSEGLLLLTNNGDFAREFELPVNKIKRIYKVRACGDLNMLLSAPKSFEIDGINYNVANIKLLRSGNYNSWLQVELEEGKNREIRKIFNYFGLSVNRLIRISYGQYELDDMQPGEVIEIKI